MDRVSLVASVVLLFSAAITALFGWAIYRGDASLVAGYDPERVSDEAGLARFVGRGTLLLAGVTAAFGVASAVETPSLPAVVGYTVVTLAVAAWLAVGARRYER